MLSVLQALVFDLGLCKKKNMSGIMAFPGLLGQLNTFCCILPSGETCLDCRPIPAAGLWFDLTHPHNLKSGV